MTLRSPAASLAAPDSPFAGLVGAGRRAAFRRRLIRRVAAVVVLVIAVGLILLRPGASGQDRPDAGVASTAPDGATLPTAIPSPSPAPSPSPGAPSGAAPGPGDGLGSESVPAGRIGVVVPIEPALAARLSAGDRVDIYRSGSPNRVATEALVVDVTRPSALQQSDFGPGSGVDPSAAAATVFVAVSAREAAGIPAGQRGAERSPTTWWVTLLPRPVLASP